MFGTMLRTVQNKKCVFEQKFQIVELVLKSNASLGFGIGFSMSESPRGCNFQPDWTEIRPNFLGWGRLINQSESEYLLKRNLIRRLIRFL